MGTFSRISNVVRAEVDEVLNNLEDPKKMVRQMVRDMEDALDDAVVAVAQAMANEKLLARRIAQKREDSDLWARKAEDAMAAGEEELARKALVQKVAVDEAVNTLQKAREEAEGQVGVCPHATKHAGDSQTGGGAGDATRCACRSL